MTDELEPNSRLIADAILHVRTTANKTGCEVLEWNFGLDEMAGKWRSCWLPPFATVYAGQYDDEAHEDIQPVVCWRHLRALGDTKELIVRPMRE